MEFVRIQLADMRSAAYMGSEPVVRATWLSLLAYCASVENGGVIGDCRSWASRLWEQLAGVTKEEVEQSSQLWSWDGDDLKLAFYPARDEEALRAKREGGRKGGKAKRRELEGMFEGMLEAPPEELPTDKTRPEQTREEKKDKQDKNGRERPDGCGDSALDWEDVMLWMAENSSSIPDRHRAQALARELIEEMSAKNWEIDGKPVENPMGLVIHRLKKDGAYNPKNR